MLVKICTKCKQEFPATKDNFHAEKNGNLGLRADCKKCRNKVSKKWRENNNEYNKSRLAKWRRNNPDYGKTWESKNKKERKEQRRERFKKNPALKIVANLRTRLYHVIIGRKSAPTMKLIGCDIQSLRNHLESLFEEGMNWDNYGDWHIDHIKPCAAFDLSQPDQQKKCFHYSNLQPLWAEDNLRKASRG